MACLNAIKCIPAVASRSLPQNVEVATSIWIALHDPEKVSIIACVSLQYICHLVIVKRWTAHTHDPEFY